MNLRQVSGRCVSIAIVFIPLLIMGCSTKHIVRPVFSDAFVQERGVFYALPRTVITVDIPITRIEKSPSSLVKRAESEGKLDDVKKAALTQLGLVEKDLTLKEKKGFQLGDPTIGVRAEPDPTQVYVIELKGEFLKNRNFNFQLTEDGLLSSAESSIEDKRVEFVVKTVETAASVVGKALKVTVAQLAQKVDHEKVIEQISEIRKHRLDLISGKVPRSSALTADTLDRMLKELENAERELLRNFTGVEKTETRSLRFEVRPDRKDLANPIPLCGFSEEHGVLVVGSTNVMPPSIPKDFTSSEPGKPIELALALNPAKEQQLFKKIGTPTGGERSYYYRIPAIVLAKLLYKGEVELIRKRLAVAQFGKAVSLPPDIGGSSSKFKPTYYVDSGAIKELTIEGRALDLSSVSGLGASAGTVFEALKEREQAKEAEKEELNQLKRQASILEQKARIRELQKKLIELQ